MRMLMWNEKGWEVVKPSANHVNGVKKGVELRRCIGVGMGQKNGINSKKEIMGNQMKVVRK